VIRHFGGGPDSASSFVWPTPTTSRLIIFGHQCAANDVNTVRLW
jgi:hypothetical protein